MTAPVRILEIGNYPPPHCGWSVRTKFLVEHLRRAGADCQVLNIGPSRREKQKDVTDVQNGPDYLWKLFKFGMRRFRFHVHANGDSPKGFGLALAALGLGRLLGPPPVLTFHAGINQRFFPQKTFARRVLFRLLFGLPGEVVCNSEPVREAIASYGVNRSKIHAIAAFSPRYMEDAAGDGELPPRIAAFMANHSPTLLCYTAFRPEFALDQLLDSVAAVTDQWNDLGLVIIGNLEDHEPIVGLASTLGIDDRVLFAGDLPHQQFLAALREADLYVRTHLRDGISSSVLEAVALGTKVLASENESRPPQVVTYTGTSGRDLTDKLRACLQTPREPSETSATPNRNGDTLENEARLLLRI